MKKLGFLSMFLLFAFISMNVYSQQKAVKPDNQKTIKVKDVKMAELKDRALSWMNFFYNNDDNQIIQKDIKDNSLSISAKSKISDKKMIIEYSITFIFRNGEYTYTISDRSKSPELKTEAQKLFKNISQRIERMMVSTIAK
ncbi:MAG: hypothetical protein NTW49_10145 [Bacteroidia bacterium]|nr:hypothetical protein [Bacteroidia bacterium]